MRLKLFRCYDSENSKDTMFYSCTYYHSSDQKNLEKLLMRDINIWSLEHDKTYTPISLHSMSGRIGEIREVMKKFVKILQKCDWKCSYYENKFSCGIAFKENCDKIIVWKLTNQS